MREGYVSAAPAGAQPQASSMQNRIEAAIDFMISPRSWCGHSWSSRPGLIIATRRVRPYRDQDVSIAWEARADELFSGNDDRPNNKCDAFAAHAGPDSA